MAPKNQLLNAPSISDLGHKLVDYSLTQFDIVGRAGIIYTYPLGIYCSTSCEYDFDLGWVGLGKSRWTRLINMYVCPKHLKDFERRVGNMSKDSHIVTMPFRELTKTNHKERNHPWGGCLISLSYRKKPATLVLHSRTTRIGYTSFLDMGIAHVVGRDVVSPIVGLPLNKINFTWVVELPQMSCMFILRYLIRHPRWQKYLTKRKRPIAEPWTSIIRNYRRIKKGKHTTWGPTKSIYRDIHRKKKISTPISSLGLFGK